MFQVGYRRLQNRMGDMSKNLFVCPFWGVSYREIPGYVSGYGCPVCRGISCDHVLVDPEEFRKTWKELAEQKNFKTHAPALEMSDEELRDIEAHIEEGERLKEEWGVDCTDPTHDMVAQHRKSLLEEVKGLRSLLQVEIALSAVLEQDGVELKEEIRQLRKALKGQCSCDAHAGYVCQPCQVLVQTERPDDMYEE